MRPEASVSQSSSICIVQQQPKPSDRDMWEMKVESSCNKLQGGTQFISG